MIFLRLRSFGQEEWTYLSINGEDEDLALQIIGSALDTSDLQVQSQQEDNSWEDLT